MGRQNAGYLWRTARDPRGAAHLVAGLEKLQDAMLGNETGGAGNHHGVGHVTSQSRIGNWTEVSEPSPIDGCVLVSNGVDDSQPRLLAGPPAENHGGETGTAPLSFDLFDDLVGRSNKGHVLHHRGGHQGYGRAAVAGEIGV